MKRILLLSKFEKHQSVCTVPYDGAAHVIAPGCCPCCASMPWKVGGSGMRASEDDLAWEADAGCMICKAHVGTLRVEMNTLFGVREDLAVLGGRVRVY